MSLLGWFSRRTRGAAARHSSGLGDSEFSRSEATRPLSRSFDGPAGAARPPARTEAPAAKKPVQPAAAAAPDSAARHEARDQLYSVVRESMVRSGVLTSAYKFKVLAVDTGRRHFIVMVDLARAHGGEPARFSEIEVLMAQTARQRFGILVSAVYWRLSEQVAVGRPEVRTTSAVPPQSAAAARATTPSSPRPAEVAETPAPSDFAPDATQPWLRPTAAEPQRHVRYEPIGAEEVDAFKRALAAGASAPATAAAAVPAAAPERPAPKTADRPKRSPLWNKPQRLTGYEDTQAFQNDAPNPGLSATQYGDL